MIQYILLGMLNYQSMTGYDLKQMIDQSISHFWHAYHSQIYTTLRQMEQDALVSSVFIREEGQPDRRVYTITDAGKAALSAWLDQSMTEMTPIKEELLVRLFFSARREPEKVLAELILQRSLHQEKLADYHRIADEFHRPEHSLPGLERDAHFWRATLELGIHYEETYLEWLQQTIHLIEGL